MVIDLYHPLAMQERLPEGYGLVTSSVAHYVSNGNRVYVLKDSECDKWYIGFHSYLPADPGEENPDTPEYALSDKAVSIEEAMRLMLEDNEKNP